MAPPRKLRVLHDYETRSKRIPSSLSASYFSWEVPMLYTLRVSLPDQPGVLGALALALGRRGVNIVTLDVIERTDGIAVDDLMVEAPEGTTEALRHAAEAVPSAFVEAI